MIDMIKCQICGKENSDESLFCGWCGHSIQDTTPKVKEQDAIEDKVIKTHSSIKSFGLILITLGFIADIISIPMIFSASAEAFGIITVIGTICFLIGLAFAFI